MFKRNYKNFIYGLILIIPVILLFRQSPFVTSIQFKLVNFLSVPTKILSFPLKEIKKILYYHWTFNEYRRVQEENEHLRARLIGLEEVIQENSRFEQLLNFKRRLVYSSIAANVIGRDPSYWNASMIIDKGAVDGIKLNQPVVNAMGVVGKIAEVGPKTSKVILLKDPQFSVTALVQRSRETGIVTGSLQGVCRMVYINQDPQIQVGDKIITSKLSTSFPEGLLVGEVERIDHTVSSPSQQVIIKPAVLFSQLEEVLVIIDEEY